MGYNISITMTENKDTEPNHIATHFIYPNRHSVNKNYTFDENNLYHKLDQPFNWANKLAATYIVNKNLYEASKSDVEDEIIRTYGVPIKTFYTLIFDSVCDNLDKYLETSYSRKSWSDAILDMMKYSDTLYMKVERDELQNFKSYTELILAGYPLIGFNSCEGKFFQTYYGIDMEYLILGTNPKDINLTLTVGEQYSISLESIRNEEEYKYVWIRICGLNNWKFYQNFQTKKKYYWTGSNVKAHINADGTWDFDKEFNDRLISLQKSLNTHLTTNWEINE